MKWIVTVTVLEAHNPEALAYQIFHGFILAAMNLDKFQPRWRD